MGRRAWWLVYGMLLGPAAGPAAGQAIGSSYRFVEEGQAASVYVGYVATDRGVLDLGPESGWLAGVRYGIRLSGPFVLEAGAGFFPSVRAIWRADTTATDTTRRQVGETDLTLGLATASLRFDVTGPRTYRGLLPYILFSAGAAFELGRDEQADQAVPAEARFRFGTTFAGQVGVGLELFATRRLAVHVDLRDMFWELEAPAGFVTATGRVPQQEWVQNFVLTAGLSYRF
ncbi:MAG: hypothetical protein HY703_13365 [Gemmatimonadetes bacterium]|nr:hypothetical protein [Gemmatimonadota bacterium]